MAELSRQEIILNLARLAEQNVKDLVALASEEIKGHHPLEDTGDDNNFFRGGNHRLHAFYDILQEVERRYLVIAVSEYHGNVAMISRECGIPQATLYRKLKFHNIPLPRKNKSTPSQS